MQDQPGSAVGAEAKQPFVTTAPVQFAEVPPVELSPPVLEPVAAPLAPPVEPSPPEEIEEEPPTRGVPPGDPAED